MPVTSLYLTPFEEQMLQMFVDNKAHQGVYSPRHLAWIADRGISAFGDQWPGSERVSQHGSSSYPLISRFAGRLTAKGLLLRCKGGIILGESWSLWRLTPSAIELLGLPPEES